MAGLIEVKTVVGTMEKVEAEKAEHEATADKIHVTTEQDKKVITKKGTRVKK